MKKQTQTLLTFLTLVSVLLLNFCSSRAENVTEIPIKPDTAIVKIVGDTVADVLFTPKSVTLYLSKNRKKLNDKEVEITTGFVRDTLVAKLNPSDVAILQFVLLSDTINYKKDKEQIKSPYSVRIYLRQKERNCAGAYFFFRQLLGNQTRQQDRLQIQFCKPRVAEPLYRPCV